jgi:hypothetical protein
MVLSTTIEALAIPVLTEAWIRKSFQVPSGINKKVEIDSILTRLITTENTHKSTTTG